jgi:hypothetical protein
VTARTKVTTVAKRYDNRIAGFDNRMADVYSPCMGHHTWRTQMADTITPFPSELRAASIEVVYPAWGQPLDIHLRRVGARVTLCGQRHQAFIAARLNYSDCDECNRVAREAQ